MIPSGVTKYGERILRIATQKSRLDAKRAYVEKTTEKPVHSDGDGPATMSAVSTQHSKVIITSFQPRIWVAHFRSPRHELHVHVLGMIQISKNDASCSFF